MSDLALTWGTGAADLSVTANDLTLDDGLETAIMLSLFTDRRAETGDVLPDSETDRRGWWGDALPVVDGDQFGSRLWLLSRSKQTAEVLSRAEEYAKEALAWLIEDRVTDQITITASVPSPGVLGLAIVMTRPSLDAVTYRFNYTWASQEAKRL